MPVDRLHFPLGLLARAVLVLVVDVAVFVHVELIGDVFHFAAGAGAHFAAGLLLDVAPESAGLVVAAAATAGGATRATALTVGSTGLFGLGEAVGEGVGSVGFGPLAPPVLVVAADSADQTISKLEHEGSLLEVASVQDKIG